MKNFLLSLFVCLPALAFAQNPTECGASLEIRLTVDVVTTVRVTHVEKLIYVQMTWPLGDPSGCVSGGCANCDQRTQANVHHGRKIIMRTLMKDVCPLMGGWGF